MENKITEATIELADNGYIMRYSDSVLVYTHTNKQNHDGYKEMIEDLMCDLDNEIDEGGCSKIRVRVEVEPINDNDNEQEQ